MDYKRIASLVGVAAYVTATAIACSSSTTTPNNTPNSSGNGSTTSSTTTTPTYSNGISTSATTATTAATSSAANSSAPSSSSLSGNQGCGLPAETCAATVASGAVQTQSCTYVNSAGSTGSGPVFYFDDQMNGAGGASTSCVTQGYLCTAGTTNAVDSAYKHYGSGFGFQVNEFAGGGDAGAPTLASGGLMWAATGTLPASFRVGITTFSGACSGSAGCCYQVAAAATSGTIPWSMFTVDCYDAMPDGGTFNPTTDGLAEIKFQADAQTAGGSYNYCITSISF